jgi:hypothetical protein
MTILERLTATWRTVEAMDYDPFEEIHERLDRLERRVRLLETPSPAAASRAEADKKIA